MTLAAAYWIGQVPALLSDVLVSGPSQGRPHSPIPTRVDLTGPLPTNWSVTVNGLSRKSIVPCANLAVAVAGSGLAAAVICRKLQARFAGHVPSRAAFAAYMAGGDDAMSAATSCVFVGWLIEDATAWSSRWVSSDPGTIAWDEDFVEGTGAQLFREIAWSPHQRQPAFARDWAGTTGCSMRTTGPRSPISRTGSSSS